MKIGDSIKTIHGEGVVTGFDLPNDPKIKRVIVKIDAWISEKIKEEFEYLNSMGGLCYYDKNILK